MSITTVLWIKAACDTFMRIILPAAILLILVIILRGKADKVVTSEHKES